MNDTAVLWVGPPSQTWQGKRAAEGIEGAYLADATINGEAAASVLRGPYAHVDWDDGREPGRRLRVEVAAA